MLYLKSSIRTVLSVLESCADSLHHRLCESLRCGEGGPFCCGSNAPPEVVSELQQRRAGVCVNGKAGGVDQGCVSLMVLTVCKLNRSFTRHRQRTPKQRDRTKQLVVSRATYMRKENLQL